MCGHTRSGRVLPEVDGSKFVGDATRQAAVGPKRSRAPNMAVQRKSPERIELQFFFFEF